MKRIAAALLLMMATTAHAAARPQVFLLIGQSNMVGYGKEPGLPADPRIHSFGLNEKTVVAHDPLHEGRNEPVGVGPGMFFAKEVAERADEDIQIILVPCAQGNTTLFDWSPNGTLYWAAVLRARTAAIMNQGELAGVLVFQGESEARNATLAAHWRWNFTVLITRLRSDLERPELPVVFAEVAHFPNDPFMNTVRNEQESVRLPNVAMIKTDDVPHYDDGHVTTAGQRIIGRRFANAYLKLRRNDATAH